MLDSTTVRSTMPKLRNDDQLFLVRSRGDSTISECQSCRTVSGDALSVDDSLDSGNQFLEPEPTCKKNSALGRDIKLHLLSDRVCSMGRTLFARSLLTLSCLVVLLLSQPGCSLFVMAGKAIVGDPKVPSQLRQRTGIDLIEDEKTVLIVCTTPEFLRLENSAIDRDIVEGVYRRFRRKEIRCIDPNDVDGWLGRVGGAWENPTEIVQEFETDYIIHFNLDHVSYVEENSPAFYRGQAHGNVKVYASREISGQKTALLVFEQEYKTTYPNHYPISSDSMSQRAFAEKFTKRISDELARIFYDYRVGEELN